MLHLYLFLTFWQPLLEQNSSTGPEYKYHHLKNRASRSKSSITKSFHRPYLNISLCPSPKPGDKEVSLWNWATGACPEAAYGNEAVGESIPYSQRQREHGLPALPLREAQNPFICLARGNLNQPRADLSQSCLLEGLNFLGFIKNLVKGRRQGWNEPLEQSRHWVKPGFYTVQSAAGMANFSFREVTKKGTCNLSSSLTSALGQAWPKDLIPNAARHVLHAKVPRSESVRHSNA